MEYIAFALASLAGVERQQGDDARARAHFAKSLDLFRDIRHIGGTASAHRGLGYVAAGQGALVEATAHFIDSLALFEAGTEPTVRALSLAGLAAIANAYGQSERAARLCGAADPRIPPLDQIEYNRTIATIRAQLDEATFAAAWAEGQQMTLEAAIAEALADAAAADGSALDAKESST